MLIFLFFSFLPIILPTTFISTVRFSQHMKAIALLSGGIDSPVAAWLMKRKGFELVFVHFNNFDNLQTIDKAKKLAAVIDKDAKFLSISFKDTQQKIAAHCNRRFQCVLCKRAMYRAAEKIAEQEGAQLLLTGESLGQVASQTLDNLAVLDSATKLEVLRPLLGYDKEDTIKIAREIGTYDISIEKSCDCPFVPLHPLTGAKLERVEEQERRLAE
jgi:tRNA uracil 4-sulfurtransferase